MDHAVPAGRDFQVNPPDIFPLNPGVIAAVLGRDLQGRNIGGMDRDRFVGVFNIFSQVMT